MDPRAAQRVDELREKSGLEATSQITGADAQIRSIIQSVTEAIRAKDTKKILSVYSAEAVIFDLRDSLQYGIEHLEASWEEFFEMTEEFAVEIWDLEIRLDQTLAFSHSLSHATGMMDDGERMDLWFRVTTCYSKIEGIWKVVHEHTSVPGDFVNGRLLTDLRLERDPEKRVH